MRVFINSSKKSSQEDEFFWEEFVQTIIGSADRRKICTIFRFIYTHLTTTACMFLAIGLSQQTNI